MLRRQVASVRQAAELALTSMSEAKDVFAAGLAGDYGEVCLEFLRIFDVHDHDPGTAARQVKDFTRDLRLLFVEGHIARAPDGASSASTPASVSTSAAPGRASTSAAPGSVATPATPEPRSEPRRKTLTQIALHRVGAPHAEWLHEHRLQGSKVRFLKNQSWHH